MQPADEMEEQKDVYCGSKKIPARTELELQSESYNL